MNQSVAVDLPQGPFIISGSAVFLAPVAVLFRASENELVYILERNARVLNQIRGTSKSSKNTFETIHPKCVNPPPKYSYG